MLSLPSSRWNHSPPLDKGKVIMEHHVPTSSSLKRPRSPEDLTLTSKASPNRSAVTLPHLKEYKDSQPRTRESIVQQIEDIFTTLINSLNSSGTTPLQLPLTPRRPTSSTFDPLTSTIRRSSSTNPAMTVSFPKDAWRFACVLKTLDTIHESLVEDRRVTTKRDLFYKSPKLFRNQKVVDRIVDDLAATLGVERSALGIVASAKGMVYGDVTIGGRHFLADGGGIVVPDELEGLVVGDEVDWVLVVEKEAVFRSLACGGGRKGVVVTGKGYPDVATREVVRMLSDARKRDGVPLCVFALVDMDPHGIEIMATYRFGSVAMAWENHRLAVERVQWLGVKSEDLGELIMGNDSTRNVDGLLRLTASDKRKALAMLAREWMHIVPEWKCELQKMLFLNVKAEIEILGVGVQQWVEEKIAAEMGA